MVIFAYCSTFNLFYGTRKKGKVLGLENNTKDRLVKVNDLLYFMSYTLNVSNSSFSQELTVQPLNNGINY